MDWTILEEQLVLRAHIEPKKKFMEVEEKHIVENPTKKEKHIEKSKIHHK